MGLMATIVGGAKGIKDNIIDPQVEAQRSADKLANDTVQKQQDLLNQRKKTEQDLRKKEADAIARNLARAQGRANQNGLTGTILTSPLGLKNEPSYSAKTAIGQ